jgi:hypothetical protein
MTDEHRPEPETTTPAAAAIDRAVEAACAPLRLRIEELERRTSPVGFGRILARYEAELG